MEEMSIRGVTLRGSGSFITLILVCVFGSDSAWMFGSACASRKRCDLFVCLRFGIKLGAVLGAYHCCLTEQLSFCGKSFDWVG
jgi:hypothetical protein